jgi:hypothetical protein
MDSIEEPGCLGKDRLDQRVMLDSRHLRLRVILLALGMRTANSASSH